MDAEHTEAIGKVATATERIDRTLDNRVQRKDDMPKRRKRAKQVQAAAEVLKPRAFVPRACTSCTALRPPNTSYSVVYGKVGRVRYCRCKFCQHTWTQTISADQVD